MIEAKRMWASGPLRLCSMERDGSCRMPLASSGFGGAYVCDGCLGPVAGVYRVIDGVQGHQLWLCASCKAQRKKEKGRSCYQHAQPSEWLESHSTEP